MRSFDALLLAATLTSPSAVFDGNARPAPVQVAVGEIIEIPPSAQVEMGFDRIDHLQFKEQTWFQRRYKETAALYPDSDLKTERVYKPLVRCSGFLSCLGKGIASPLVTPFKMAVYNTIDSVFDASVYPWSRGPFNPLPPLAPLTGFIAGAVVGVVGAVGCALKAVGKLFRGDFL